MGQNEQGRVIGEGKAPTTVEGLGQIVAGLDAPAQTTVGLETGTQATWVSRQWTALGMSPVAIDAREAPCYAKPPTMALGRNTP